MDYDMNEHHHWDTINANTRRISGLMIATIDMMREVANDIAGDVHKLRVATRKEVVDTDDLQACWAAIENSDDPRDIALLKRIREKTGADK